MCKVAGTGRELWTAPLVTNEAVKGWRGSQCLLYGFLFLQPTSAPWYKPSRRDFIMAGIGSLFGGGAMYVYDTYVIEDLYDEIDDLEDELAFVDEEDMLQKAEANARQFDDNPPAND